MFTWLCILPEGVNRDNPQTIFAHGYFVHSFHLGHAAYFRQMCMLACMAAQNCRIFIGLWKRGAQPADDDWRNYLSNLPYTDHPSHNQARETSEIQPTLL